MEGSTDEESTTVEEDEVDFYDVDIHAFSFLSNHYHLLISVDDAEQMAGFVGYFQSKLAREIARLTGRAPTRGGTVSSWPPPVPPTGRSG